MREDAELAAMSEQLGLEPDLRSRLRDLVRAQIDAGLASGMQVLVARRGCVAVEECVGRRPRDDEPITPDTRFAIFSSTKPITATAVHILVERGLLAYTDPVVRHLPEFGRFGKEAVNVRHLLLHQAGFPDLLGRTPIDRYFDPDRGYAAVCEQPLEYPPGKRVEYHAWNAYVVLAEIVERLDGRAFEGFCEEEIFDPLGMTSTTWGVPEHVSASVTDTVGGDDETEAVCARFRSRAVRSAVVPAGGLYSTARDLARFYQMWADGGRCGSGYLLRPATVRHVTMLHAPMVPGGTFGFGYGFMVGAQPDALLRRGALASLSCFGHPGFCSAQALHDPAYDLSIVALANGAPRQDENDRRLAILCDTVYRAVLDGEES